MAEKLTPQQKMAVENRGGKLLVSAAAGSGKTKVLVDRLMLYLTDPVQPANLDEFLIITYTKAAAAELRGKIASKLTERIAQEPENRHLQRQLQRLYLTQISTVHSFCSNVLREYAYRLDIPADFRVAEESECREVQDAVLQELLERVYAEGENEKFLIFADTQGTGRDDSAIPELVIKVFNSARCHRNPEGWLEDCLQSSRLSDVTDAGQTAWGGFLMKDLKDYLDGQIRVMDRCAEELADSPKMEKIAELFADVSNQLKFLQQAETWDQVNERQNINFGRLNYPRKDYDVLLKAKTKAAFDACKTEVRKRLTYFTDKSEQVIKDMQQTCDAAEGLIGLVRQFMAEYGAAKQKRRIMDFSDLEHRMLELLLEKNQDRIIPTKIARDIGRRFREVMVDEYQDSNEVQDAIFTALTEERQNCFMVGDVKQSIYQFRLADPEIFKAKYDAYVDAENAAPGEGRWILLSDNFRSGAEVIEAVNDVFRHCMSEPVGGVDYGDAEALREGVAHMPLPDAGVELHVLSAEEESREEEAAFVAHRIREMLRDGTTVRDGDQLRPVRPEDIVILLRSAKRAAEVFQKALENVGIRCSTGDRDLMKSEEIQTMRCLLQTVANPRQDIPLVSVLASPVFGFTADDLAAVRSGQRDCAFYDAVCRSELPKAKQFLNVLEILRKEARMNTLSELIERCCSLTRIDSVYGSMSGGQVKKANLRQFYQMASDYESTGLRTLDQFLDHLEAAEERGLKYDMGGGNGAVTIMTVHSSKGLEFPVVFLCGLERKFNTESRKEQILCHKDLFLGMKTANTEKRVRYPSIAHRAICAKMAQEEVSEEMRVLYVAMTRARDRLIMTYTGSGAEKKLEETALRFGFDGGKLLCREASRPGEWVLLTAIQHTEAGELHQAAGVNTGTGMGQYPWRIQFHESVEKAEGSAAAAKETRALPEGAEEAIARGRTFRYGHAAAVMAPSKQTATGRKGRYKDNEVSENAAEQHGIQRAWRQPGFLSQKKDGRAYGNAMHGAMQYIRYENCENTEAVEREIRRLVKEGFLTEEQGGMVNAGQIAGFFETEIGRKLRDGAECLREFKFSILDDGSRYGEGLEGEYVLLQGVVDCALLEEDGITVLDFKSDYVTEETVTQAVERYRLQVQTYAEALTRIYEKKVKESWLYFFRLGKLLPV